MTNNRLRDHFPMLRDREEVLADIYKNEALTLTFDHWTKSQQEEFLNFCTGIRGVKVLYDCFFKEIFNPDEKPERLERLLSLLLENEVRILHVLPNESGGIAAEGALLVMDIVVQLSDGSIVNIEIQKIGYHFPGQRCACYSADLLLRQYKRVKGAKGKKFSYRDMKPVYTIVFFENSPTEFRKLQHTWIHRVSPRSDTGVQLELLQDYLFVALDIFRKNLQNKAKETINELEAWLIFLCMDDPEWITELTESRPEFQAFYREIYEMCRNTERVMGLFSEELAIMDKNTAQYMIDEMQEQLDEQKRLFDQQEKLLGERERRLDEQGKRLDEQEKRLDEKEKLLDEKGAVIAKQENEILALRQQIEELTKRLNEEKP